jgi:hypothetical protein
LRIVGKGSLAGTEGWGTCATAAEADVAAGGAVAWVAFRERFAGAVVGGETEGGVSTATVSMVAGRVRAGTADATACGNGGEGGEGERRPSASPRRADVTRRPTASTSAAVAAKGTTTRARPRSFVLETRARRAAEPEPRSITVSV